MRNACNTLRRVLNFHLVFYVQQNMSNVFFVPFFFSKYKQVENIEMYSGNYIVLVFCVGWGGCWVEHLTLVSAILVSL